MVKPQIARVIPHIVIIRVFVCIFVPTHVKVGTSHANNIFRDILITSGGNTYEPAVNRLIPSCSLIFNTDSNPVVCSCFLAHISLHTVVEFFSIRLRCTYQVTPGLICISSVGTWVMIKGIHDDPFSTKMFTKCNFDVYIPVTVTDYVHVVNRDTSRSVGNFQRVTLTSATKRNPYVVCCPIGIFYCGLPTYPEIACIMTDNFQCASTWVRFTRVRPRV